MSVSNVKHEEEMNHLHDGMFRGLNLREGNTVTFPQIFLCPNTRAAPVTQTDANHCTKALPPLISPKELAASQQTILQQC